MNVDRFRGVAFSLVLILIPLAMPFHRSTTNGLILLLSVLWLSEGDFLSKMRKVQQEPLLLASILFYVLFVLSLLWTENMKAGLFNIEKKYTLLLLPVIIGTAQNFRHEHIKSVIRAFLAGCFLASVISLGYALYRFTINNDVNVFFHDELAALLDFQPPYFGLYLAWAIIVLLLPLSNQKFGLGLTQGQTIVLLLFFFIMILLLSARMVTGFIVITIIAFFWNFFAKQGKKFTGVGIVVLLLVGTSIFIVSSDYLRDRVIRPLVSDIRVIDGGGETGLSIRLVKWRCSWEGFSDNPITGVGSGDAIDYLVSCYESKNFWGMYPQYRFNAHNQFLETALTLGLMGLAALAALFIIPLLQAIRFRDYRLVTFLSLFATAALTESVFERQWGIVLFTLFVPLLYFGNTNAAVDTQPIDKNTG